MGAILDHLVKEQGWDMPVAKAALSQWELRPLKIGDLQVGELMLKNNEVHFALDKRYHLVLGRVRLLQETLSSLLEEKGFLVTVLAPKDKHTKLIERFGFSRIGEANGKVTYWMNKGDPIRVGEKA